MAIHVAEEARHISFAHEYLRKRVPQLPRRKRFWLSLYVPVTMRILCSAIVVPPKAFWKEFDIPREVRKDVFFRSPESRQMLRDMFGDVRMLCHDTGLMNPLRQADVADLQDQRQAVALPQRTAAPAPGRRTGCLEDRLFMPHVITQSCCSDGSCVFACPVNCIHPSPDEPGFATAEMLYIDPVACVDCGACVSACPVGAIAPDTRLTPEQLPFVALNASYYPERSADQKLPPTSKLAPVIPAPEVRGHHRGPLTVAIVGSGPAAMYAADELLTQHGVRVNVFEKLPTPYGLVRAGVAPDHQTTKRVTALFDRIARRREFRFYLNVEVGKHLSHDDLLAHHHAVLYAVGAPNDRRLDIDGMGLPGTGTATELVAWINGHPEFTDLPVDLSHERVVIVGNGNVALDVARVLTADPDELARTDISDHALQALRTSRVHEVVIAARRGPAHSAFTLPELIGLTTTAMSCSTPPTTSWCCATSQASRTP